MSGRIPFSGGVYSYVYTSLGEFPAWLIGWSSLLRHGIAGCSLARAWAEYIAGLYSVIAGSDLPDWLHHLDLGGGVICSPLAAVFVILCHMILL